jgi:regulatory protein
MRNAPCVAGEKWNAPVVAPCFCDAQGQAKTSGNADSEKKELTRAKNSAYRYLTYRPRSRSEIEQKLQDKGFDDKIIETVLVDLERLGYVNDLQFAGQWAAGRARLRGFGRRRIEMELRQKGIDPEVIKRSLSDVCGGDAEAETAKKAAERKITSMRKLDRDTRRRRLAGFLERKGFSFEIIRGVLKDMEVCL